jgi:hypothetical protein
MSEAIGSAAASGLQPADSSEHERLSTIESVMMAWKALDLTGKQASLVGRNRFDLVVGVFWMTQVLFCAYVGGTYRIKHHWR